MITILFDTETTGLLKPKASPLETQPHIIEIYCLKVEESIEDGERVFSVMDEYETFLNPGEPITAEITKITGISTEQVKDAPTFPQVYSELARFFHGSSRMVAHNVSFDRQMLVNELLRIDKQYHFPYPPQHICTVEKTMQIEQRRLNLQKLHIHFFGKEFPNAHRAKADVIPLFKCYKECVKRGYIL